MSAFLVVDDHAILRSGLVRMLKASFPDVILGEAGEGDQAIQLLKNGSWDVMILDIGLPGRSGLEILKEVQCMRPELPVLILTGMADDAVAIRVFEAGAMGYLSKGCSEEELTSAVRKLLEGGRYLTASIAEKLVANLNQQNLRKHEASSTLHLKGRTFDVMLRLGQGDTVKAIAEDMKLSIKTISTYRSRILERFHLKSNADIVRFCLLRGLSQ
ncbi:MAG: response regulator transcription factor [bacterium]